VILFHAGVTMVVVWFVMRGNPRVDYRVVAIASLLPDLIDKPIGRVLFRARYNSGRLWAHALLVNVAFFCVLFFMRGRAKRTFVLIPISTLLHLAEDTMWNMPRVFWWPLLGTSFPRDRSTSLLGIRWKGALIEEAIGLVLIAWLLASHGLLSQEGVRSFLRTGMLERPKEIAT
jgi:hypothetical protein